MVKINGESVQGVEGMSVIDYLNSNGYNVNRVVVEKNLEVLPRSNMEGILLEDEDSIEIIQFVGGGWITILYNINCQIKQEWRN